MLQVTWFLYMASLIICFFSYALCVKAARQSNMTLNGYLFDGNSPFACIVSIIGSTFSTVFLFATLPAVYFSYSFLMVIPAVLSAIIGLWLLKWSLNGVKNGDRVSISKKNSPIRDYLSLLNQKKVPFSFWIICLVYIVQVFVSEIGALKNGLELMGEVDVWSKLTVYLISLVAVLYVYVGGFRGVLITDKLQTFFLFTAILVFFAVAKSTSSSQVNIGEVFKYTPDIKRLVWGCFGMIIVAITWLSSAPELYIRLLTIPKRKTTFVISWSMIGFPIALTIPIFFILLSGVQYPCSDGYTAAFEVWNAFLFGQKHIFTKLSFVIIIVSATITTIDTMIITAQQLLQSVREKYQIVSDHIREKDIRFIAVSSFIALIIIGLNIPFRANISLGIFAYSLMIPVFFMKFLAPLIFGGRRRCPNLSYLLVLLFSVFAIIYNNKLQDENIHNYHTIPVILFAFYSIHLLWAYIYCRLGEFIRGK